MANKQKTGRITIANIIAIVGLVLLLVFSFIGHSYLSGGELGWDIVISVGITAFTGFLLWFLIKAKGAENQLDKWRKIEYATLAIYIVFAIPASLMGGIMHFFVVNDNKATIKSYAQADVKKINDLILEYKEFESQAITKTGTGLRNVTGPNQRGDIELNQFMEENHIEHNRNSANNFETIQRNNLIGANFETYSTNIRQQQQDFLNVVNGWSVMQIPSKTKMIEELAISVEKELTRKSNEAKLPKIEYQNGVYTITQSNQCRDFKINGGIENFQFKHELQTKSGFSFTALFVVILIHILILFNYIVAYRTNIMEVGKCKEEDGGKLL